MSYFDPTYFGSYFVAADSPYFECDYFDETYFDTPDCGTPTVSGGHHAVRPRSIVARPPDDDLWLLFD